MELLVTTVPPPGVGALVLEEDTYLVLGTPDEVREPAEARLRTFHEAYTARPASPGSVVAEEGAPLRLRAVVHDLSQDPTWREEWVAAALVAALVEANRRGIRSLAVQPLGRVHGNLPMERLVGLLRSALEALAPGSLERIALVVPEDELAAFREVLAPSAWS